ncbi:MAG TPA: hypothetical protein EYN73_05030 [Chromatiaceae bacterium]|jgi:cation diffusion facilitator CzcD-associated flavoprotein CzcO|nr:hypothetical protein [Chromatiaceae bacterium]HIA08430.1 hypothetical protein [Chromatiaceae bacterium]HIN82511.1 hypothetical protein [Chromatiales bacterium]HIO15004.1 hypothetical protein [Chromatiales bacterium]HIO53788.1 hypothetical protein [Chromatiales bacterium]
MKASVLVVAVGLTLMVTQVFAGYSGHRNWLRDANLEYKDVLVSQGPHVYGWGYNYRANGRHSTVQLKHDKTGWMYNGNYRSSSDTGTYRWEGFKSAR